MAPLRLHLPATPEAISRVRDAVATRAEEAGISDLWAVRVCVSEAVTNVVLHAYRHREGALEVTTHAAEDRTLEVTISDDGRGFRPRQDSPGLGLGVPLISRLATDVEISDGPRGGTTLTMVFREDDTRP